MVKLFSILSLISFTFADTDVYSGGSIQDAITNATPGETIIVHDGTYTENLLIDKDIILRSENGRDHTTISGQNETNGSDLGSTIVVRPPSGSSVSPDVEINGFNIINGKGSTIYESLVGQNGQITEVPKKVGGGLVVCKNSPTVINNKFQNNGNTNTAKGGAVYAASDTEDCDWSTRDYVNPSFTMDDTPLDFSNNVFLENYAVYAKSIYIIGYEETTTNLTNGYFDVYSDDLEGSSGYWIHTLYSDTDESDGDGLVDAVAYNAYVNTVTGSDNNDGTTANTAFLTINHALSQVYASAENPMTIHLSGTYSPGVPGAVFPIVLPSYVFIVGDGPSTSIIDAQGTTRVMEIIDTQGNGISNIQIRGGVASGGSGVEKSGGGIWCENSSPSITNSTIAYNEAEYWGAGLYVNNSNPYLYNVIIDNNNLNIDAGSGAAGAGIMFNYSTGYLDSVIIDNNHSGSEWINGATLGYAGGLMCIHSSPTIINSFIVNNSSISAGGGIWLSHSDPIFENVNISFNTSGSSAAIMCYQSNPTISNSNILYNSISNDGAPSNNDYIIVGYDNANPIISNCLISNNQGSYLYVNTSNSNSIFSNLTITNNIVETLIYGNGDLLINSIVWDNQSNDMSNMAVAYSNIQGGYAGESNINIDPLFNEDYTLQAGSPSIDMGTAYFEWEGQVIVDIPESDYYNTAPDMGAFEFCANFDDFCDCDGNVLDCDGICGGSAIDDCAGECNGSAEMAHYWIDADGDGLGLGSGSPSVVDDVVAYFTFDGDVNDYSGSNLNGSPVGITYTEDRFGNENGAIYIDSKADGVDIPDFNSSNISVSMWFQFNAPGSNWSTLLCHQGGGYHHLLIDKDSHQIGFYNSSWHSSGIALTVGQWYHIVLVKEGSNSKIYLDNELIQDSNSSFSNSTYPISIIGNYGSWTQGALGSIDDVQIYNQILNADEIAALYSVTGSTTYCSANVPDGWADNTNDEDDNCYSNEYDCVGECTDTGSAVVDECGVCDGDGSSCSCGTGDMNQDNTLNVLDIVYLVELILASDTPNEDEICQGDIGIDGGEGDGMLNVIDIVALVNIILNP